jgi:hypothetical protein
MEQGEGLYKRRTLKRGGDILADIEGYKGLWMTDKRKR